MSSILLMVTLANCFVASDASPGWKQVTLPENGQALAAPKGVEQFRSGALTTIIDTTSALFLEGSDDGLGVTAFDFTLGEGGRSLELRFAQPLRGAKVDVEGSGDFGKMSLLREARIGGATLSLAWGMSDVKWVHVRVHQHLRKTPVLDGYTSVRQVPLDHLGVSAAFRLKGSLYYLQPSGPPVQLCVAPEQLLSVTPGHPSMKDEPTPVILKPSSL